MTNRALAERHIDASNRMAVEEIEALLTEDVIWDMSRSMSPFRGVYQGDAEVRGLLMTYLEAFESAIVTAFSFYEVGDLMAVEVEVRAQGRGSGAEVTARGGRVYGFRDGKIERFILFQNMDDAREYVDAQP